MSKFETAAIEGDGFCYIQGTLVPKILALIAESGISYDAAALVPALLKAEIEECTVASNKMLRFTVPDGKNTQ